MHQICDSGVGNTSMVSTTSDGFANVKLTDCVDGIAALTKKPQYKGKGRAWKKTPNDADPAFRSKVNVSNLPKRMLVRKKAMCKSVWKEGIDAFRAHVKREERTSGA